MTMRILLTADPEIVVPPIGYGGIERIVDALVRQFREEGHTVGLVARAGSSAPAHQTYDWPGTTSRGGLATLRNLLALRRAVQDFQPDVLHSFSRLIYLLPLLSGRLPKVMSYQRHTGGRQVALAARLGGHSLCFTGCSEFICGMGRPSGGQWQAVPNFVEPEKYRFVPAVPSDAPLVFLSRIESIKGPDLAIAVAKSSGRQLILAGNHAESGPEKRFWDEAILPHIGHDGIEWVGEVNDLQKNELLGRAAALIVPIRWDEPFGIVFPEALACGTPVISCRRGALPEIITEGRTGFFMQDLADGVDAVRRLGELDRAACRQAVLERFCLTVCAREYLGLYHRLRTGS